MCMCCRKNVHNVSLRKLESMMASYEAVDVNILLSHLGRTNLWFHCSSQEARYFTVTW